METIEARVFQNEQVAVDGKTFRSCTFEKATLLFAGEALPTFVDCQFVDVSLRFDGAASRTLRFLSGMRAGGFSAAVAGVFRTIQGGV